MSGAAVRKLTVSVKVTELKEQQPTTKAGAKQKERATNQASQFGLTVRQLDAQEKEAGGDAGQTSSSRK